MGPLTRSPGTGRDRDRRGFALVLVLLLLLAFTALAQGSLVLARAHRRTGGLVGLVRARQWTAASLAVARARALDSVPAGDTLLESRAVPGGRARVWVLGLAPELALVHAGVDSAGNAQGAAALVWALDPRARVAALPAGVVTGRPVQGAAGIVDGGRAACPPDVTAVVRDPFPLVGILPPDDSALALGRLGSDDLLDRLPPAAAPDGTPEPRSESGDCVEGPWNWGAPSDADGPCGGRWVAVARDGDLGLLGGEGQGLFVVTGDLMLQDTRLEGLLLVGGDLELRGGSSIRGTARVGGRVLVDAPATWLVDPCATWRALEAGAALRAPRVLPGAGWAFP